MPPLQRTEQEWKDLLRLAASVRLESQLIREAAAESRERGELACTRSRMLLERCVASTHRATALARQPRSSQDSTSRSVKSLRSSTRLRAVSMRA